MDATVGEGNQRRHTERSWLDWVSEHPKTVAAVLVLLLLVGAWVVVDALGRRRLERAGRAILARGEPLTVDDLRKRLPVIADDDNMAIGLAEHGARIQVVDPASPTNSASLPILSNAKQVAVGVRWPPEQEAAAEWFCEQNAAAIEGIEAASKLPNGQYPIRWTSPAIKILLPQLSFHRSIVKSLAVGALRAAHNGRTAECLQHLVAMASTDRGLRNEPFLISSLVRIACQNLTTDTLIRCLALTSFDDTQLRALDAAIASFADGPTLHDAMLMERVSTVDMVRDAYVSGNIAASTSAPVPPGILLKLVPGIKGVDPAICLEQVTRICDAATLPPNKAIAEVERIENGMSGLPLYAVFSKILTPSLSRAFTMWFRTDAIRRATRAAIAAERYRLKYGCWPDALRNVVPEFLPVTAIVDPFNGNSLVYRRDEIGICIYSVGEDGNDDGGVIDREQWTPSRRAIFDPGVVLPSPGRRNLSPSTQAAGE